MCVPLSAIALGRQRAHLGRMSQPKGDGRATKRPDTFEKPAHWTSDPAPEPAPPKVDEDLSPTRYGDWVKDGIAVDF